MKFKGSLAYTPNALRFTSQLVLEKSWLVRLPSLTILGPPSAQSLLCLPPAVLVSGWYPATTSKGITSFFIAHTSSCAKPVPSSEFVYPHLVRRSLQVAASPCWEPVLPDVISAILSSDAWSSIPTVPPSALACFFLGVIGLPKTLFRSASRWYPRTRFFPRVSSRGCRHFFMFRPPSLLASQIAPTAAKFLQGSRGFYIRAYRASLPLHAPDMLSVRIQAIDRKRTFAFLDLQPCRPLRVPH